jgi:hypothetical protein
VKHRLTAIAFGLLLASPLPTMACAACFGRSDSRLAVGMNWGIFSLLVVIATMMGLIASFFVFIARRAATLPVEQPTDPAAPASTPTSPTADRIES